MKYKIRINSNLSQETKINFERDREIETFTVFFLSVSFFFLYKYIYDKIHRSKRFGFVLRQIKWLFFAEKNPFDSETNTGSLLEFKKIIIITIIFTHTIFRESYMVVEVRIRSSQPELTNQTPTFPGNEQHTKKEREAEKNTER